MGREGQGKADRQLLLQPHQHQEHQPYREVVRGAVAHRYVGAGGLFAHAQQQPPPQPASRLAHIGEPVSHVAHGIQLPEQRPHEQHRRRAVGRERLQHHPQRQHSRVGGDEPPRVPLVPRQAGQGGTHDYRRRLRQLAIPRAATPTATRRSTRLSTPRRATTTPYCVTYRSRRPHRRSDSKVRSHIPNLSPSRRS